MGPVAFGVLKWDPPTLGVFDLFGGSHSFTLGPWAQALADIGLLFSSVLSWPELWAFMEALAMEAGPLGRIKRLGACC